MKKRYSSATLSSVGILFLRLIFGGLMMTHGYNKLVHFSKIASDFPDPLHLTHRFSLQLTIIAELFCSALVVIGISTRLAAVPVVFCMLIAVFVINRGQPILEHELAPLFLSAFTCIALTGSGKFSVDRLFEVGRRIHNPQADKSNE